MHRERRFAALIAAAGNSSRMKTPKALLEWRGRTFLEMLLEAYLQESIAKIYVTVSDHPDERILRICERDKIEVTRNRFPDEGMLGSIRTVLTPAFDAYLVNPIDAPFTPSKLISQMVCAFDDKRTICVATHAGKKGHPIAFSKHFFHDVRTLDANLGGFAQIIQSHPRGIIEIESNDPRILCNINTPSDYADLQNLPAISVSPSR